jgi:hypothetical protein
MNQCEDKSPSEDNKEKGAGQIKRIKDTERQELKKRKTPSTPNPPISCPNPRILTEMITGNHPLR